MEAAQLSFRKRFFNSTNPGISSENGCQRKMPRNRWDLLRAIFPGVVSGNVGLLTDSSGSTNDTYVVIIVYGKKAAEETQT